MSTDNDDTTSVQIQIGTGPVFATMSVDSGSVHTDDDGRVQCTIEIDHMNEIGDAWAAGELGRAWTFPDSDGEYNGVVFATYGEHGISFDIWDEINPDDHFNETAGIYATSDSPISLTVTVL